MIDQESSCEDEEDEENKEDKEVTEEIMRQ